MDNLPSGVTREGDDEEPLKPPFPVPKPEFNLPQWSTWTNDTTKLELSTYFDPNKPNLSQDFGLDGLQPVIRDTESDMFLLQDNSNRFYQWSVWEGLMWQLEDLDSLQAAVDAIMRDSGTLKKSPVWREQTG